MGSSRRDRDPLSRVRAAKAHLQKALASRDDVRGIGITRIGEAYGLKVNLADSAGKASVPDTVQGIRVVVDVVGQIRKR